MVQHLIIYIDVLHMTTIFLLNAITSTLILLKEIQTSRKN